MGSVEAYYKLLKSNLKWKEVGLFIDEDIGEQQSLLVVLLEKDSIVAVFRVCLETPEKTIEAIQHFAQREDGKITLRSYQGEFFTSEQIRSLEVLNGFWELTSNQSMELGSAKQVEIVKNLLSGEKKSGRLKDFSTSTKQQVNMDAHRRCMFEGCGVNLWIDDLTGIKGNYSYLAHNVGASENGPRGIPEISGEKSDDPSNVILLCDKHHRLIDRVAKVDYPAHRLSKMREDFCILVESLLDSLSYEPVPAIAVLWPVQRTVISAPTKTQISQSLAKMGWRMSSSLMSPSSDNDSIMRDLPSEDIRSIWPSVISVAADKIKSSLGNHQYRAALFAFGPMPQLISLAAMLGNKQEIIPMLRFRDSNQWVWPEDQPQGSQYKVMGLTDLGDREDEIILMLSFTNHPGHFDKFSSQTDLKAVKVRANVFGNGAIGHPIDCISFMSHMQRLLHIIKTSNGVKKVHLLPCASNAICVSFGKAFDVHHPELIVYDFTESTMKPSMRIYNQDGECRIENVDTD